MRCEMKCLASCYDAAGLKLKLKQIFFFFFFT